MDSVDKALAKADYDWDGYISWDEYVFSLGDQEVQHHVKEHDTHEYDHHNNTTHWLKSMDTGMEKNWRRINIIAKKKTKKKFITILVLKVLKSILF